MFYTYILQSNKDKQFYTGYTDDLQKRVKEHGDGKVASTKNRLPLKLVYYFITKRVQINRTLHIERSISKLLGANDTSKRDCKII
jgi:predicted GIY-YIG superfamily endonuclease